MQVKIHKVLNSLAQMCNDFPLFAQTFTGQLAQSIRVLAKELCKSEARHVMSLTIESYYYEWREAAKELGEMLQHNSSLKKLKLRVLGRILSSETLF